MKLTRKSKCFDLMMVVNLSSKFLIYFVIAWEFTNSYLPQQMEFLNQKNNINGIYQKHVGVKQVAKIF